MAHNLAFVGIGVVIPEKDVAHLQINAIADDIGGLHVDWIEYACGQYGVDKNVYIITLEDSRKEIYEDNYSCDIYPEGEVRMDFIREGREKFKELSEKLSMDLLERWVIAQYRM
jgi:hypothetical protein